MTTYCSVNDTYLNKLSKDVDLDKMARDVNNQKKALNNGIRAFNELENKKYDKGARIYNNNFLTRYDTNDNYYELPNKYNKKDDEVISLDTPSESVTDNDSSFSSLSWETTNKDIDNTIREKTKYNPKKVSKRYKCTDFDLKSVDSLESIDSGESLLRHIRYCLECKDKIMTLIKKNKLDEQRHDKTNNNRCLSSIDNINKQKDVNSEKEHSYIPEIKEIVAIFLVGFLVIVILDLFMNRD